MINLQGVSLQVGGRDLLNNASCRIFPGHKVGVIGANGCGKSTLFKLLLKQQDSDAGSIEIPAGWEVAHMAQEVSATDQSALEYALDGDHRLRDLQRELDAAEADGSNGKRIAELHERMAAIDGYSGPARAAQLLDGLGFSHGDQQRPVKSFSGGWRIRLNLARALMCPADLLLLDEPTNHLDLEMRHALTLALAEFPGAMLLVSHDRHLLANTTDEFILVADGRAEPYDGDLDDYKQWLLSFKRDEKRRQDSDMDTGDTPAAAPVEDKKAQRRAAAALREQLKPLTNKLKSIEQKMAKAEKELAALENQLADEDLYSGGQQDEIARLTKAQGETRGALDELEMEWLEISEQLETARGE
ncbi:ATP-binding cassette domain-containing protein [Microbulbifer mangrovi]|uniref:ATP-binding cassette domain-containing protein n=1 Tax=Microbulbifer mangrovi TaxID=927787 RepID=UPI0009908414|nr:ATP-binding cassette domain-containing protein [Microbulbifer mangrovi]